MGTYVVGDIHGCLSQWLAFKEKIEKRDEDARFILVGDLPTKICGLHLISLYALLR